VRFTSVTAELSAGELNSNVVDQLSRLAPFGEGNPEPRFLIRDVSVHSVSNFGRDGTFLKVEFRDPGGVMGTTKFFDPTDEQKTFKRGDVMDLVISSYMDDYNGYQTLTWTLHATNRK